MTLYAPTIRSGRTNHQLPYLDLMFPKQIITPKPPLQLAHKQPGVDSKACCQCQHLPFGNIRPNFGNELIKSRLINTERHRSRIGQPLFLVDLDQ